MSLNTTEILELGLNRLIYAAEQISRHFEKGGELFDTLNIGYPFNDSFDDVLNALIQWRDSACNKQTQLLPTTITLKESNLQHAARNVIAKWERGDLAGAIRQLSNALEPTAHSNHTVDTSLEIVIPLPTGGSLRCGPGENHQHGGYIRICDPDGIEIIYWDNAEWSETPELVMGAVFTSALTPIDELLVQTGRSQIVGDHWE
jgi:hypothetical protein